MSVVLTIAIPTFNRRPRLQRCLITLMEQVAGKPVELLVSDNASSDDTQPFMEAFCLEHPEVTYIRNPENIGPDKNFLNCYNCASGEYVLLLGDDDVFLPGAIDAIIEALRRKPVMLHLNTCNILSQEPLSYNAPRYPEGDMLILKDATDMLETMGIFVTFMSSFILRNDLVREVENKEQYIGTYFIQSHIALKTMRAEGEYIFVRKNCLAASGNETVTYDVYYVWGRMYGQLLNGTAVSAGMDPERVRRQHRKDLGSMIPTFIKTYRKSCEGSDQWDKEGILSQVRPYPIQYLKFWALVNLPVPVVDFIINVKSHFKKQEPV